jgi:hypothetical protein
VRRISINTPLVLSLAFIAVATISVLVQLPPLLEALITPRPGTDPTQARLSEYLTGHDEDLATYRGRFDGRSLFIKPQPPPRSRPAPPPPVNEGPDEPPPPPPARNYEGPTVLFVLGDEVWFHDGLKVRVGEEGPNGVSVISSDPPWTVRLGHRGGEHDIVLFERSQPGLAEKPRAQRPLPGLVRVENDDDDETKEPGGEGAEQATP